MFKAFSILWNFIWEVGFWLLGGALIARFLGQFPAVEGQTLFAAIGVPFVLGVTFLFIKMNGFAKAFFALTGGGVLGLLMVFAH